MSSIRKRNGKYQAQVRINGASLTRSFRTKSEASSWSRQQEARLETRKASGYKPSSFAEILQRYLNDVTPLKRNTSFEPGVIRMFLKQAWAHKPIDQISLDDLGIDASQRLKTLKVEEPPAREAGIMVDSVSVLVDKLKNEAKVI